MCRPLAGSLTEGPMHRCSFRRIIVCHLAAALWCQAAVAQASSAAVATDSSSLAVVRAYFAIYNAHDIEGTVRLLAPDFRWLSAQGDSVVVEARGIPEIRAGLVDYFRRLPTARSEIEAASALGPWVMVRERASWVTATGPRSQGAISVYEVRDGLLRSVWYYPSVRE